jgi:O-antigen/teichoic acid export membrane protein
MSTAIMRFGAIMYAEEKFGQLKKLRQDVLRISILSSLFLGLVLILVREYLIDAFFDNADISNMLLMFAFSLPFYSYLTIQSSFLKAYKRPELAPFFEVGLSAFVTGAAVAGLAWFGLQVDGLLAAMVLFCSSIVIVFFGYLTLSKIIKKSEKGKHFDLEDYKDFYRSLPDYSLSDITGYLLKFSPIIILGIYATGKDVGLFSLANSTAFVINFILWIVNTVYAPHFANYFSQGRISELKSLVLSCVFYMMFVAVPIFLFIVSFPSYILGFFGAEFIEAKNALIIMAFAQLFNVATGPVYFLLNMTGHERNLRNIVFVTAIASIVTSLVLVPLYGFMGVTIASALGLLLQNSMAFHHSAKLLGIDFLSFKKPKNNKI